MAIIDRIRANGADVIRDGHRFTLRKGRLSPDAIEWLRSRWRDVCAEVWPEFEEWDERAAIMEFDGGMSREDAEAVAYREVMNA